MQDMLSFSKIPLLMSPSQLNLMDGVLAITFAHASYISSFFSIITFFQRCVCDKRNALHVHWNSRKNNKIAMFNIYLFQAFWEKTFRCFRFHFNHTSLLRSSVKVSTIMKITLVTMSNVLKLGILSWESKDLPSSSALPTWLLSWSPWLPWKSPPPPRLPPQWLPIIPQSPAVWLRAAARRTPTVARGRSARARNGAGRTRSASWSRISARTTKTATPASSAPRRSSGERRRRRSASRGKIHH